MAAALTFMCGNQTTLKDGQKYCGRACSFSKFDEANQYRTKYGNSIDLINEWTSKAYGELPPHMGQCIRFENNLP